MHRRMAELNAHFQGDNTEAEATIRRQIGVYRAELAKRNADAEQAKSQEDWQAMYQLNSDAQQLVEKLDERLPQVDQYELNVTNGKKSR